MMKRHRTAKLQRIRGSLAATALLASVERMTEAEAKDWYWLLQNLEDDARAEGVREGGRQPWRRS